MRGKPCRYYNTISKRVRKKLREVSLGLTDAQSVLVGASLVNVHTGEVLKQDLAIHSGRIALVGDVSDVIGKKTKVYAADGKYILPGFVDGHTHFEISMLTAVPFSQAVLPRGTSSVIVDPHDTVNVLGIRGMEVLCEEVKDIPLKVFFTIPPCVPSTTLFETAGAFIGSKEVITASHLSDRIIGIAEVMDFERVLCGEEELQRIISFGEMSGMTIDGHSPGLLNKRLCAYVSSGVQTCHEVDNIEEAIQKLRLGVKLLIRVGTIEDSFSKIGELLLNKRIDARNCMLVTDGCIPADDLIKIGHLDHALQRIIDAGVDPVTAIQMATINPAEVYGLSKHIGCLSPGRSADIVIVDDINEVKASSVIVNGIKIAEEGKLLIKIKPYPFPVDVRSTIKLRKTLKEDDFKIPAPMGKEWVNARVIGVSDETLFTSHLVERMKVVNGEIVPDTINDIIKVACVERHGKTGGVSLGLVKGFGIKSGAFGGSIGQDAQNIIVVGVSDRDMYLVVDVISKLQGGLVLVKEGKILEYLKLEFAGIATSAPVEEVAEKLEKCKKLVKEEMGCSLKSPFTTLSLSLTLAVIPDLKITDKGLIDVKTNTLTNLLT